jgi:hypothetical protein
VTDQDVVQMFTFFAGVAVTVSVLFCLFSIRKSSRRLAQHFCAVPVPIDPAHCTDRPSGGPHKYDGYDADGSCIFCHQVPDEVTVFRDPDQAIGGRIVYPPKL